MAHVRLRAAIAVSRARAHTRVKETMSPPLFTYRSAISYSTYNYEVGPRAEVFNPTLDLGADERGGRGGRKGEERGSRETEISVSDSRRVLRRARKEEGKTCGTERNTRARARARRRARVLSLTLDGGQFQTRRWTVSHAVDRSFLSRRSRGPRDEKIGVPDPDRRRVAATWTSRRHLLRSSRMTSRASGRTKVRAADREVTTHGGRSL